MMKNTKVLLAAVALLAVCGIGLSLWSAMRKPKTAYVDLAALYNNFELKKELEKKLTNVQQVRKSILDSMSMNLAALYNRIEAMNNAGEQQRQGMLYTQRRQEYAMKQQEFGQDNATLTQQYQDQIWKQINQYVKEYGKEQGYEYIFGAESSGTLMYAADKLNITDAVKDYVNKRYKGGK